MTVRSRWVPPVWTRFGRGLPGDPIGLKIRRKPSDVEIRLQAFGVEIRWALDGPQGAVMYEQEQGRPQAGEELSGRVWMPVKHAARAAGVPERSAFRWAKKGAVEVRRSGKVQLVEVAALAAYAARPVNARVAEVGATVAAGASLAAFAPGSRGFPGAQAPIAATTAAEEALEERLCLMEVLLQELEARLEALERAAGAAG